MAIHIDIYAHLRKRELVKEGEELKRYVDYLERGISKRYVAGAQGRSQKIIKFNDAETASFDKLVNASDAHIKSVERYKAALKSLEAISKRRVKTDEDLKKQEKDLAVAKRELAAAEQDRVYRAQQLSKAINDQTRATKDLNDETKSHTKNLRQVANLTRKNKKEFTALTRDTNKLRRELESLHTSNIDAVRDNAAINKGMRQVSDATKKTTKERAKYNEMIKEGVASHKQLREQSERVRDAHINERRVIEAVNSSLSDTIQSRREHDVVVRANVASLRDLSRATLNQQRSAEDLHRTHLTTIRDSTVLTRSFDQVNVATEKAFREHQKYNQMARDGSVSQAALRSQLDRTTDAYRAQSRATKNASDELGRHLQKQEEAQIKEDERKALGRKFSVGQYLSKNVGALTPLGTVSPTVLFPLVGILGSVGEALVTVSQSATLLPASLAAAGAGFLSLKIGLNGFGQALKDMGDPKKFAEALYQMTPAAQQAALQVKALVDGPLGDLRKATQEALFFNVSGLLGDLTAKFGPMIQRMTTSIASSFNRMFTGASLQLMTPEMQGRIQDIINNIVSMFERLEPAVAPFIDAFTRITQVGASFLPGLADSIARVATSFDNFIIRVQNSGQLQEFIQKGIDAVKALSGWLLQVGQDLYATFGNKSPQEFIGTLNSIKDIALGLAEVFRGVAHVLNMILPVLNGIASAMGGWNNLMNTFLGIWLSIRALQLAKFIQELAGSFGLMTSAAATAGTASAASLTAAGTAGGTGFAARAAGAIKGFGWAAVGAAIAIPIIDALDDRFQKWVQSHMSPEEAAKLRSSNDNRYIPNWVPILPFWEDQIRDRVDPGWRDRGGPGDQPPWSPTAPKYGPRVGEGTPAEIPAYMPPVNYPNLYPNQANLPLPNVPLDENGKAMSDTDILNKYRGELPRESYAVNPFVDPITGQTLNPMLPIGPNGMPEYPAGGVPGTPSIPGPVMPHYNAFGQLQGYGANMVDPEAVFDAQLSVQQRATDLEEANKDLLAAKKAGILSEEQIHDLETKVYDKKLQLHKALVALGDAQTGDYEKLNTKAQGISDALGQIGAAIDKDFGISKGLPGIVENLTKMLANLAFAPVFGAMRGAQAGLGFPGGEGAGSGLAGIVASSMGWYRGGPMDQQMAMQQYQQGGLPAVAGGPANAAAYQAYLQSIQAGPQGSGGYPGDRALINSIVPMSGNQYISKAGVGDLTQGIGDCTSSIEDLINTIDGKPTAGRSMATGNAESWLKERGFLPNPTGANIPGAFNVGWNSHHMQATLPGGTNWNWGGDASAQARGMTGGGAFDPSQGFTMHYYRPQPVTTPPPTAGSPYGPPLTGGASPATVPGMLNPSGATIPPFDITDPRLSPPPHFAQGGEVPIIAHSGEHVLNRADVAAMGGQQGVYNFRRALHYDWGGAVGQPPYKPDPNMIAPGDLNELLGAPASAKPQMSDIAPLDLPPASPFGPDVTTPAANQVGPFPTPASVPAALVPAASVPAINASPGPPPPGGGPIPAGVPTAGAPIGSQVEPYAGYGPGLSISGGIIGAALGAAGSAAGAAASAAAMGMDGGAGGAAASAAIQIGIQELTRAIEFGAQAAGIGAQGLLETFLPAGGSALAQENWLTRWMGGIVGAAPAIANLAGGAGAQLGAGANLPGVGPSTPEQIAAQAMDPNRSLHTGVQPAPGPVNNVGVHIENYQTTDNRAASQDFGRYALPGAR